MSAARGNGEPDAAKVSGLSNLQLRVISAVILGAAVLALTYAGGLAFRVLAAAIAGAIFFEWTFMSQRTENRGFQLLIGALLAVVLLAMAAGSGAAFTWILAGAGLVAALAAGRLLRHGYSGAAGFAYAAFSGISLGYLRGDDFSGLAAILFLYAVVWTTDIMAYFVGRAFGGPKLAPAISPGKTWSGAVGGAVFGVAAGLVAAALLGGAAGIGVALAAFVLSGVAQIGDLFESAVKRRHGVKDSGSLIPGHGGVMDRVDGLVAAAFALYVIGVVLAGPDNPAHGIFPA